MIPQDPAGDAEGRTSWPVNLHLRADGFLPTHPLLPVRGASLDQDNVRTVVRAGGTFWKPWRQQKAGGGGGQSSRGGVAPVESISSRRLPLTLSADRRGFWENSGGRGLPGTQQALGHPVTALPLVIACRAPWQACVLPHRSLWWEGPLQMRRPRLKSGAVAGLAPL